ncbi:hypothetical protein ACHAQC_006689 [Fusarium culmorum]
MAATSLNPTEAIDRNTPIKLSEKQLIERACNFEHFSSPSLAPGVVVHDGLENADDLTAYGVTETYQKELWREEIKRLSKVISDMNEPIHFNGSREFRIDSKEAHESLARLADKMLIALNITFHDSQAVLKDMSDVVETCGIRKKARRSLERFVADNSNDDDDDDGNEKSQACNASQGTSDVNHADYFEFVDYVTATITRMLCKAASGKSWHEIIIVKFAKTAAKMKVVSGDLWSHAASSLQNHPSDGPTPKIRFEGAENRNAHYGKKGTERDVLDNLDGMLEMLNKRENQPAFAGPNTSYLAVTRIYYMLESMIQMPIYGLYEHILASLRGTNTLLRALNTSYEISAMLYKTGYGKFPVFLSQDIDGEFLGSSLDENINISHASFQIVNSAVQGLVHRLPQQDATDRTSVNGILPESDAPGSSVVSDMHTTPPPSSKNPKSVGTTISCYYSENPQSNGREQKKKYRLNSMSNVITVIVPMVLTSPVFVMKVNKFIGLFTFVVGNLFEEDSPMLYRPTEFETSFCLTTDEYRTVWAERIGKGYTSQLSDSLVARDTLLSWPPGNQSLRRIKTTDLSLPTNVSPQEEQEREERENLEEQEQIQNNLKQFEKAQERMKDWIFEENGVRVRCDWYVGTVSAAAILLVICGLAAAITVGERLPGVDPFNIATFSWVLAAFIVLIAKSSRVTSWPWWDFLHRQVLCRSVSELGAVSGIDHQLLLARLLQEESGTRLQTRGPYNTAFSRKASGGDGFSIDQPLSIRTMLLSGLIMIQVQAVYHGSFLVCLDLRRGTDLNVVLQTREAVVDKDECIISERLTNEPAQGETHRINLKTTKASWSRVAGVYGRKNVIFC